MRFRLIAARGYQRWGARYVNGELDDAQTAAVAWAEEIQIPVLVSLAPQGGVVTSVQLVTPKGQAQPKKARR